MSRLGKKLTGVAPIAAFTMLPGGESSLECATQRRYSYDFIGTS
jgi:hypothetical protein